MKLHGKVVAKEIKDYGKGKDAEPSEVGIITVKLDGKAGKLTYEPGDDAFEEIGLRDKCVVNVEFSQQKLDLNNRAAQRRAAAEAH